ncbi:hypothetical protein [Mesorhizobium sp. M4B.F.Ca.ET.017.02.2.1]|uniref:hypothetical protein n=1 Tax=Mesorhizobium sp. M4B.F.Ca.ET.017.02.2.1 TaxID=2496649 RepID=UPI001675A894|nr:hypothetical protein [Mesorhizobium sp. M4B.F.Ca.ET.017.02.2.1]
MREGTTSAYQRWPTRLEPVPPHGTRCLLIEANVIFPLITCVTTLGKGKTDPDHQNVKG